MPAHIRPRPRMTRMQRTATAALTTAGVAAMALIAVPAPADAEDAAVRTQNARPVHWDVRAEEVPGQASGSDPATAVAQRHAGDRNDLLLSAEAAGRQQHAEKKASEEAARQAARERADRAEQRERADRDRDRAAERRAARERAEERRAAESAPAEAPATSTDAKPAAPATEPAPTAAAAPAPAPAPAPVSYPDTLDGWIREALDIMARKGIPGSYDGLYRNIMRESSGNPNAINLWDINAINGTPSIGLLQVIQPTFDTYHVEGTSTNIYDPVANITAAANYAYHRYGSIDNVNGPY